MDELLTLDEAALMLKVHPQTARLWVKAGRLKAYKPGRAYKIPLSAITEFLETRVVSDGDQVAPPETEPDE